MTWPYLIVDTPRAGELGHRFVVPPSVLDEAEVARVAGRASREGRGEDFVSVTRNVVQRLGGGAVRNGPETLILAGIDVGRLDDRAIGRLKSSLESLWPRVDNLVEDFAQGSYPTRDTLAHAAELEDWKDELCRDDKLPAFVKPSSKPRTRLPIAVILPGAILALMTLVLIMFARRRLESVPPPRSARPSIQETQRLRGTLEELANRWNCGPEDVARSLQRATNWDKRDKPQKFDEFLISAGSEDRVLQISGELSQGTPGACFGFIEKDHPAEAEVLRGLLHAGGDGPTLRLRRSLFESWEAFKQVRGTSQEVADLLEMADVSPSGFRKTIGFLRKISVPAGLGSGFSAPSTPIFDRQDVLIVDLIETIFRDGPSQGLSDAFEQSNALDVLKPSSLSDKLAQLASRANSIREAEDHELKDVLVKITREEVKASFQSLGKFLECVGRLSAR